MVVVYITVNSKSQGQLIPPLDSLNFFLHCHVTEKAPTASSLTNFKKPSSY